MRMQLFLGGRENRKSLKRGCKRCISLYGVSCFRDAILKANSDFEEKMHPTSKHHQNEDA
jgi:hypothetical protein